jgi:hypothetical protein
MHFSSVPKNEATSTLSSRAEAAQKGMGCHALHQRYTFVPIAI